VAAPASSIYNGTYPASNALNSDWGTNFHMLGNGDATRYWRVDWSIAQSLNRVDTWGPGPSNAGDGMGESRIEFSDGTSVTGFCLLPNVHQTIEFSRKTGITWLRIVGVEASAGNAGTNPGFREVRVYDVA
jgi:hypothetical protein